MNQACTVKQNCLGSCLACWQQGMTYLSIIFSTIQISSIVPKYFWHCCAHCTCKETAPCKNKMSLCCKSQFLIFLTLYSFGWCWLFWDPILPRPRGSQTLSWSFKVEDHPVWLPQPYPTGGFVGIAATVGHRESSERAYLCLSVCACVRATAALQNQKRLLEVQLATSPGFPPSSVSHKFAQLVTAARDQRYFSVWILFLRGFWGHLVSQKCAFQWHPGSCKTWSGFLLSLLAAGEFNFRNNQTLCIMWATEKGL